MAKRILIIDDELDMRVYLRALFRKAGYETEEAENGVEGLRRAKEFGPHLITLDIMMPKRSGVIAYRDLRTSPQTRTIPVIVLTGLSRYEELFGEEDGLPAPDALVEKPIVRELFLRKVRDLIGG